MSDSRTRRLDPRAPFVIDTRELSRRAGSLRRTRLSVPAPAGWRTDLAEVPAGAPLEMDLRLESVMEGILVTATVRAPVVGECSRCLDPLRSEFDVDVQQLFAYPDLRGRAGRSAGGSDSAEDLDEVGELDEDRLDLEPPVRDAVVLALPLAPRCREDCPGLCPACGERLADLPADHGHAAPDSRWAALAALAVPGENAAGARTRTDPQES